MDHKTVVNDLHRARKSGALDGPPRLSVSEVANFFRRLSRSSSVDAEGLLDAAEDILAREGGQDNAAMLLDGARAGIQQAREAAAESRALVIWYDGNSARVSFSWPTGEDAGVQMRSAVEAAVASALAGNGE